MGEPQERISTTLDRVYSGHCKRLIINMPPRYGKTELAVKYFIAKGLALNPKSKYIHLTYSDSLALDNSEYARELVESAPYQQMFPEVVIKKGTDSKQKWYTTVGGGVYATSAGGQVTGFGAGTVDTIDDVPEWADEISKFGGAIIIDDPLKPEDAVYEVKRQKVNDRYDSTIQNRVNSRNTPIIIIMQRVHHEDLCGHVIRNYPGWEVLSLPVIKEDGTALWPFKHTIDELLLLKKANEFVFETQMMQNPLPPKGILFHHKDIKRFKLADIKYTDKDGSEKIKEAESVLAYTDVADEGNDFFSMPIARIYPKKVFITDVLFTKDDTDITLPLCASMMGKHGVIYNRVEVNNQGSIFRKQLRLLVGNDKILTVNSSTSKKSRILMAYGFIKEYFYFLDESEYTPGSDYDKFMRNIFSYMKDGSSTNDDAPDSISGLASFIQSFLPHLFEMKPAA